MENTEIGDASRQQACGSSQVADAVNQLDGVAPQNAGFGEQSAAAAESLSQRAVSVPRLARA